MILSNTSFVELGEIETMLMARRVGLVRKG